MRSMELSNYRCFKDFKIAFDEQLTVLVGVNGAGKTAALDALGSFLKWLRYVGIGNRTSINLVPTDVAINRKPEEITYQFNVSSSGKSASIDCLFGETSEGVINSSIAESIEYRIEELLPLSKPILASYMAGRFVSENNFTLASNARAKNIYVDIENSFNRTLDYSSTLTWFDKADADEARDMRDNGVKRKQPELVAVREALSKALLGKYERPRMHGNPPELVIYESGTEQQYKVSQLSDGYRAMLALVMDLARRMAQASVMITEPNESILNKSAIVLIDEIELHLHPSWQQTVLTTLMDIFPNTQFIVTTHSPQVLTSIPNKHIRILSDGKSYTFEEQSQGVDASLLLKRVFGVDARPGNLDIVKVLAEYSEMVYDGRWNTSEAEELRERLNEHYGSDELELSKLDLHIENKKWENSL